jgi:hypothetical protein
MGTLFKSLEAQKKTFASINPVSVRVQTIDMKGCWTHTDQTVDDSRAFLTFAARRKIKASSAEMGEIMPIFAGGFDCPSCDHSSNSCRTSAKLMNGHKRDLFRVDIRQTQTHARRDAMNDVIAMPTAQIDIHCSMLNSERPQTVRLKNIIIIFSVSREERESCSV